MKFYILIFSLVFILFACNSYTSLENTNSNFLPNASGENNEMLIVMDSTKFKGKVGRLLVDIYGSYIYGLPQPEPEFDLIYIKPRKFNSILKYVKNIVIVFSLEGNSLDSKILRKEFNEESLNRIKVDSSLFMFTKKNQYANGQNILYLFSKNDDDLYNKINQNKDIILKSFKMASLSRTTKKIFSKQEKNISKQIFDDFDINIKVPFGYDLASKKNNFIWLRQLEIDYEKNIFIYFEDYSNDDVFRNNNIESLREKISMKYLRDFEKPDIYMTTQKVFPIITKEITFKNKFSLESKGLWKLSDISGGGPFHSFVIFDDKKNRLYYIEGYVYAPGTKKRDLMQEISAILWTFEL
jgi:hypothetical protein